MQLYVYTPGFAGEQNLQAVLDRNTVDYLLEWRVSARAQGRDRIILASRDPVECVLEEYSQKGYTQPLSLDAVAQRLQSWSAALGAAQSELGAIADGYSTRTLYREDHPKPHHWARSIGVQLAPSASPRRTVTIPNAQEIRAYLSV